MELSRRGFFGLLGGTAAALAVDPERLLWIPGQKKIFIPPAPRLVTGAATLAAHFEYMRPLLMKFFEEDRQQSALFRAHFGIDDRRNAIALRNALGLPEVKLWN